MNLIAENIQFVAIIIFSITYIGIIFTRLPWVNIDRPSAAFLGAVAMIFFGVISLQNAVYAIDYNTISLLLGMMIIISTLQIDGFFSLISSKTVAYAKTRFRLLSIIVFTTGIGSAFLVNDTVVLLFTPIIISICISSKLNPIPYLIAEILSSNVGSTMAITGNPQNMLIGINSGISFGSFMLHLLPVTFAGLIVVIFFVKWFYPSEFKNKEVVSYNTEFFYNIASMKYSVTIFILVIILFFLSNKINISIPLIALTGAALIMLLGKIKPTKVIKEVDWVLLLFFASLFIVVKGIENTGIMQKILSSQAITADIQGVGFIHALSLLVSQIISNVPYTVAILPVMKAVDSELLWLSLASAATLAGNATIIGAMANLIVIESANKKGVKIGFLEFFKIGVPVTLFTMLLSFAMFYFQYIFNFLK